tara:strand:+ start:74 stop:1126 length:1053 start_codon:yes stop_codon:yes gene_type:complete
MSDTENQENQEKQPEPKSDSNLSDEEIERERKIKELEEQLKKLKEATANAQAKEDKVEGNVSVEKSNFVIDPDRSYLKLNTAKLVNALERQPDELLNSKEDLKKIMVSTEYKAQFREAYRSEQIQYLTVDFIERNGVVELIKVLNGDITKNFPTERQLDFLSGVDNNKQFDKDIGDIDPILPLVLKNSNEKLINLINENEDKYTKALKDISTGKENTHYFNLNGEDFGKTILIGLQYDEEQNSGSILKPVFLNSEGKLLDITGEDGNVEAIKDVGQKKKCLQLSGNAIASVFGNNYEEQERMPIEVDKSGILKFKAKKVTGGKRKTKKKKSNKRKRKSMKKIKSSKSKKH